MQNEQKQIRNCILRTNEENARIDAKLNAALRECDGGDADSSDGHHNANSTRDALTGDAFANMQKHIELLQAENNTLNTLVKSSQRTITNLQEEIQNYRKHFFAPNSAAQLTHKYVTAIKVLESSITTLKGSIIEKDKTIETLSEDKIHLHQDIRNLNTKIEEMQEELLRNPDQATIVKKLHKQLHDTTRKNSELERLANITKQMVEKHCAREKEALQKVQEALAIAETAVSEKNDAYRRVDAMKEESTKMAQTISQVMDDAASTVDKDMRRMRHAFDNKERQHLDVQQKLNADLQKVLKFNNALETRYKRLQEAHQVALKDIESLSEELRKTGAVMEQMKLKIKANEKLLQQNQEAMKREEEHEKQIKSFIETNNKLKERYKSELETISRKCKSELHRVHAANAKLRTELEFAKLRLSSSDNAL